MNAHDDTLRATTLVAGATPGWMVVRIGDALGALDIERVGEVLPIPTLDAVPMAPGWVAGIVDVRGVVVPVVDAGLRLLERAAPDDGRMVLVTPDTTGEQVGLLVDGVAGLIDRSGASLVRDTEGDAAFPERFVSGYVRRDDVVVALLDLAALLDAA